MDLTPVFKDRIEKAIQNSSLRKYEIAEKLGVSNAWMQKLTRSVEKGGLQTLRDSQVELMEKVLEIQFYDHAKDGALVSAAARSLSDKADSDPKIAQLLELLDEITNE